MALTEGQLIALGAGTAAGTGAINWMSSGNLNKKNRKFNAAQARIQRDWQDQAATTAYNRQRELIADQRLYDSPAAQMQRFVEAGLNPDLIYGQLNPGLMANNPDMAEGGYAASTNGIPFTDFPNVALTAAQVANLNADTNKKVSDSILSSARVKEIFGETVPSQATVSYLLASADSASATATYTLHSLREIDSRIANMDADTAGKLLDNMFSEDSFDYRLRTLIANTDISETNAKNLQRVIDASVKELLSKSAKNYSDIKLNDSIIQLNDKELEVKDALIDYYGAQSDKASADAAYVRVQKALEKAYGPSIRAGQVLKATQLQVYDDGVIHTVNKVSDRKAIENAYKPNWNE